MKTLLTHLSSLGDCRIKTVLTISTLVFIFSFTNALADAVAYKERFSDGRIHKNFQYVYYPKDCWAISKIKDDPTRYVVRDKDNLSTVSRKCFLLRTGKIIKKGKDKVLDMGKDLYDRSGAKSFFKGLLGD